MKERDFRCDTEFRYIILHRHMSEVDCVIRIIDMANSWCTIFSAFERVRALLMYRLLIVIRFSALLSLRTQTTEQAFAFLRVYITSRVTDELAQVTKRLGDIEHFIFLRSYFLSHRKHSSSSRTESISLTQTSLHNSVISRPWASYPLHRSQTLPYQYFLTLLRFL